MNVFHCRRCGLRVFFENTHCHRCEAILAFDPSLMTLLSFEAGDDGQWKPAGHEFGARRPCENYAKGVCNWTVAGDETSAFCRSCRTTRVIPDLSKPQNLQRWALLERAKRHLLWSLFTRGLSAPSKDEDPESGLWFEFLEDRSPKQRVLTGHDNGVITVNVAETDDAERERMRTAMHEPYRTLLGHFRHEVGHYFWDRLVAPTHWLEPFRALFGDERADYSTALQEHYANPPADWSERYISAYASSHPWEDWAECWAHYLHMVDALETASQWGQQLDNAVSGEAPVRATEVSTAAESIRACVVEQWLPVSQFVNAMNRSLGLPDGYPFAVADPVVEKLDFIHRVVSEAAAEAAAAAAGGANATSTSEPSASTSPSRTGLSERTSESTSA